MKKIISAVIGICMVFTAFSVLAYASDDSLKITVSADTHYQCSEDLADMGSADDDIPFCEGMQNRETFFYCSTQGQMNCESEAILRAMLDGFINSDSEYLLIAGDVTCGKRNSHLKFAEILKEAERKSGKSIFVINGNHDCDDGDFDKYISVDEFKDIYKDFGYDKALSTEPTSASYSADLNAKYRLLAIDSCIYGKDDGQITENVFNWIKEQTVKAKEDGKTLIAMMHHSILPHFEVQPMFSGYEKYAEFFADNGINLVFTGHIHANDISSASTKSGNTVYDVQTGSLIVSPNACREVTLNGFNADIVSKYVTSVDTKYLPEGFSEAQIERIKTDFPGYAAEYFEAGTCKWINRYIGSAYKVSRLLKIDEGTKEYEILDGIMKKIGASLTLDIYSDGENESIEKIAEKGGYKIPESDYVKPYQVASEIMYGFYHGDEDAAGNEKDADLLLLILKAAVTNIIAETTKGDYAEFINAIAGFDVNNELVTSAAGLNYADDVAGIVVKALFYTIAGGLTDDCSEPADINVSFNFASSQEVSPVLGVLAKIIRLITEFIERFSKLLIA